METLLLIISLGLHIITFLIIRSQQVRIETVKEKEEVLNNQSKEVEELLSTYLFEMKEENERLLAELSNKELPTIEKIKDPVFIKPVVEPKNETEDEQPANLSNGYNNSHSEYIPPVESVEQDFIEQSTSLQAYTLHKQGESVEAIARKLNCGKTEIQLMLKFYQDR